MLGGGVDAATLVAALGAGPPPPECRWSYNSHHNDSISVSTYIKHNIVSVFVYVCVYACMHVYAASGAWRV